MGEYLNQRNDQHPRDQILWNEYSANFLGLVVQTEP